MTLTTTHPFDDDHLHEECAVFGIYGTNEASINTALGLHALQHRGQEAAGIVSFDGRHFMRIAGLVMSARILTPGQRKCRLYMDMWRLAITAIQQAVKPML